MLFLYIVTSPVMKTTKCLIEQRILFRFLSELHSFVDTVTVANGKIVESCDYLLRVLIIINRHKQTYSHAFQIPFHTVPS